MLKSEVYEQQQKCFEKEEKIIFGWEILMKMLVTHWVENAYNRHVSGEGYARARLIRFL